MLAVFKGSLLVSFRRLGGGDLSSATARSFKKTCFLKAQYQSKAKLEKGGNSLSQGQGNSDLFLKPLPFGMPVQAFVAAVACVGGVSSNDSLSRDDSCVAEF